MDIPARKFITILLLAAAVLAAAFRTLPPPPLPAEAAQALFSAGRAFRTIQAITGSARLVGSPAEVTRELLDSLLNWLIET